MIRASAAFLPVLALLGCRQVDLSGSSFVTMADNTFSPRQIRVPVGGHVHFRNWGGIIHNARAVDKSWSTDAVSGRAEVKVGEWVDLKFTTPGVYQYFCSFHGTPDGENGMVGTVIVGDVAYSPTEKTGALEPVETATGVTRRVPQHYPNIQTAVDAAAPGDMVLVAEGIYKEEVIVTTPSITLRGVDRNAVILDGDCCDPFSVEAVRASMGAIFAVKLARASFDELLAYKKKRGASLIGASLKGSSLDAERALGERAVVLMGNEQSGLPADMEAACDLLVKLPMRGRADSLNLAVATAVMLYDLWRRRGYDGARA